jgi:dUTP pyrophosphatase
MVKKILKKKVDKLNSRDSCILEVKRVVKGASLPEYMMESDVGLDLRANECVEIEPMGQKAVKTGISMKIPSGCVGLIRDRAGIVSQMNVHTAAGTFDSAYTGEISVVLVNLSDNSVQIDRGMRIAQIVILPVVKVQVKEVKSLIKTPRAGKGFGSTGIKNRLKEFKTLAKKMSL